MYNPLDRVSNEIESNFESNCDYNLLKNKSVLITGATGSIGTAVVENLLNNGIRVGAIIREGSPHNDRLPHHPLLKRIYCTLQELSSLKNIEQESYDVFYHLAWDGVSGSTRQDIYKQTQNITYALDAVELANRFGCHTFIGAGSQAEYGRVEGRLQADTPSFPENGYGIAKLCAGQMCRERARQLGIRFIWVRIVSVYGPNDGNETMITTTINKLLKGERAPFTKGEQLWDYLYSGDAAEAFRLLGEKGIDGKTYVLGSGKARPIADFIRIIARECGAEDRIDLGAIPYAEKQVMRLEADISELTKDVGWIPSTKFEEGIKIVLSSLRKAD